VSALPRIRPMRLRLVKEPFDNPDAVPRAEISERMRKERKHYTANMLDLRV